MSEKFLDAAGGIGAAIAAAVLRSWQITVVILALWAICMLANLITGILAAKQAGTYSADIARRAYYKKGGVVILMVVFVLLDWCCLGLAAGVGISYTFPLISSVMIGYQIVHELTSLIDNSKKLGNSVPQFIEKGVSAANDALDKGDISSIGKDIPKDSGGNFTK